LIRFEDVSFSYGNGEDKNGIDKINLSIKRGELVVLCGESGCGKTTLTRIINGLIPNYYEGELEGEITFGDIQVKALPMHEIAKKVGSVFQNPRSQFFNINTTSELAFHCENIGIGVEEIVDRIGETSVQFAMSHLLERNIFHLSGGEKQKVACASVSTAGTEICVLDEPSSNLDVQAIKELGEILRLWKREGKTIVIAEHRLYFLLPIADRFVYMAEGKIKNIFTPEQIRSLSDRRYSDMGLRPLSLKPEEKDLIHARGTSNELYLRNFSFSYKRKAPVLNFMKLSFPGNSIIAVIGENGTGKTTFARCFCGLEKKCKGNVEINGKSYTNSQRLKLCYMVMQDVNHQLFTESVMDEVLLSMKNADNAFAEDILKKLNLHNEKELHPMSLSGGQKQRVAIAGAIASEKEILFFDEPTSGLDMRHMKEVSTMISYLHKNGNTLFIITHDHDLIEECCTHVMHLKDASTAEVYPLNQQGKLKVKDFFSPCNVG